jgi:hypothetical protein
MAKNRYINTKIWIDKYVYNLEVDEKLLFLYFLTNQHTNICGIYEIMFNQIVLDTRMKAETIFKCLQKFEDDDKIIFRDNWVAIKNFQKHQQSSKGNVQKGIENGLKEAPELLRKWVESDTKLVFDKTLEDSLRDLNYFNFNLNFNLNSNINLNNTMIDEVIPDGIVCEECDIKNLKGNKLKKRFCDKMHTYYYCPNDKNWCLKNLYEPIRNATDSHAVDMKRTSKDMLFKHRQSGQYSASFMEFLKHRLNSDQFHAILKSYKPHGNESNIKELMKIIQGVKK